MQSHVLKRIDELVMRGNAAARSQSKGDHWMRDIVESQSWLSSAANAIQQVAPDGSFFRLELDRLMANDQLKGGIPISTIEKLLGLLQSVKLEAEGGLLVKLEDQVVATAFDDFLDQASQYHKSGKIKEAAVLASAVLEDTVKRISVKAGLDPKSLSLEPLIDALAKLSVFTPVKAKRVKSYAAIRNHALHAEWAQLDLKDVGAQISGLRELLDEHL
ncbi:MAG: hypothetical protein K2Y28_09590 [Burkholderiaceae bacterium]|nr:hypothetical protein [Burkholderiaceae bacterium]